MIQEVHQYKKFNLYLRRINESTYNPLTKQTITYLQTKKKTTIDHNSKLSSFWSPIVEKIQIRLNCWNNTRISKGGRYTLLQATLSNLPTYYISLFEMPRKIVKNIERLLRNFLWEDRLRDFINILLNGKKFFFLLRKMAWSSTL